MQSSTWKKNDLIHSIFHSFCNQFHENSLQPIHNWEYEQLLNGWLN
jgi:hypothetical protein